MKENEPDLNEVVAGRVVINKNNNKNHYEYILKVDPKIFLIGSIRDVKEGVKKALSN